MSYVIRTNTQGVFNVCRIADVLQIDPRDMCDMRRSESALVWYQTARSKLLNPNLWRKFHHEECQGWVSVSGRHVVLLSDIIALQTIDDSDDAVAIGAAQVGRNTI